MTSQTLWILITLQIGMGAFDTLYHHEFTERLAWRASQHRELKLHAARNALYSLLFLTIALAEVHGLLALAAAAVLAIEVLITLMDFVEEDMSRRLPASERVSHTLLAVNYGAILVLVLPVLVEWAGMPTAVVPAWHGWWSGLAIAAAAGVAIFGVRDSFAARRTGRIRKSDAAPLVSALGGRRAVLVTGGTGFIGLRLVEALAEAGHDVTVLTRTSAKAVALAAPHTVVTSLDQISPRTEFSAIVNLAGEPIADGLWTPAKRKRIVNSRLEVTNAVIALIERLERPPAVLINGSAVGWYGVRQDEALNEQSTALPCFAHDVCAAWEAAAMQAEAYGIRVVLLRMGLVLGTEGGMLARLLAPFEFGLGGPIGSGRQWMSWIERDDLVRLIAHVIANPSIAGPVNATAPEPVRNSTFAKELAQGLRRPATMRLPGAPLAYAGGDFARELLLGGQRVLPEKALRSGFRFLHPTLHDALVYLLGSPTSDNRDVSKEARGLPRLSA